MCEVRLATCFPRRGSGRPGASLVLLLGEQRGQSTGPRDLEGNGLRLKKLSHSHAIYKPPSRIGNARAQEIHHSQILPGEAIISEVLQRIGRGAKIKN